MLAMRFKPTMCWWKEVLRQQKQPVKWCVVQCSLQNISRMDLRSLGLPLVVGRELNYTIIDVEGVSQLQFILATCIDWVGYHKFRLMLWSPIVSTMDTPRLRISGNMVVEWTPNSWQNGVTTTKDYEFSHITSNTKVLIRHLLWICVRFWCIRERNDK